MISVSCFEVGFCESNVCFRGVVVVPCDGGLLFQSFLLSSPPLLPHSITTFCLNISEDDHGGTVC